MTGTFLADYYDASVPGYEWNQHKMAPDFASNQARYRPQKYKYEQ